MKIPQNYPSLLANPYTAMRLQILDSIGASHWKKDALLTLEKRDVCDVLRDLSHLTAVFEQRYAEIVARNKEEESKLPLPERLKKAFPDIGDFEALRMESADSLAERLCEFYESTREE